MSKKQSDHVEQAGDKLADAVCVGSFVGKVFQLL